MIEHQLVIYDELWMDVNHAFKPTGAADVDSLLKTVDWFTKHLAPTGNSMSYTVEIPFLILTKTPRVYRGKDVKRGYSQQFSHTLSKA